MACHLRSISLPSRQSSPRRPHASSHCVTVWGGLVTSTVVLRRWFTCQATKFALPSKGKCWMEKSRLLLSCWICATPCKRSLLIWRPSSKSFKWLWGKEMMPLSKTGSTLISAWWRRLSNISRKQARRQLLTRQIAHWSGCWPRLGRSPSLYLSPHCSSCQSKSKCLSSLLSPRHFTREKQLFARRTNCRY